MADLQYVDVAEPACPDHRHEDAGFAVTGQKS
jgi:hypothetical protein